MWNMIRSRLRQMKNVIHIDWASLPSACPSSYQRRTHAQARTCRIVLESINLVPVKTDVFCVDLVTGTCTGWIQSSSFCKLIVHAARYMHTHTHTHMNYIKQKPSIPSRPLLAVETTCRRLWNQWSKSTFYFKIVHTLHLTTVHLARP
jgi:hypothetical protein